MTVSWLTAGILHCKVWKMPPCITLDVSKSLTLCSGGQDESMMNLTSQQSALDKEFLDPAFLELIHVSTVVGCT